MNAENNKPTEAETKRQTEETRRVVQEMLASLNRHVIDGQDAYWAEDAKWRGPAGAGLKNSLKEFQNGWQRPFLKAFPDKGGKPDIFLAEGKYAAATGYVEATHVGEFMGLTGSPDGSKKIRLRYMDFWEVKDGKIVDNWVLLDIIDFFRQHGLDILNGKGWDDRT